MATIAIIGTGNMGAGLGSGLAAKGHTIRYGSRDPRARTALATGPNVSVTTPDEALQGAEIVIIATPYREAEPFARERAATLRPLLVVDITNPFDALPDNRISGAEITAAAIGEGARVVAAFKDTFGGTLGTPTGPLGIQRDVHYAGDDAADKEVVAGLIRDLGFLPVDCGALKNARVLDAMVPLMLELDQRYGGNWSSSWKFLV